jgi:hypothetical protein
MTAPLLANARVWLRLSKWRSRQWALSEPRTQASGFFEFLQVPLKSAPQELSMRSCYQWRAQLFTSKHPHQYASEGSGRPAEWSADSPRAGAMGSEDLGVDSLPWRQALVSTSRSNPFAFQARSFQQVATLRCGHTRRIAGGAGSVACHWIGLRKWQAKPPAPPKPPRTSGDFQSQP